MNIILNLILAMQWIAGVVCGVIILVSIVNMIMNSSDEGMRNRYIVRIRNAIIAFILCILINQITNIVTSERYFNDSIGSLGIGDFSDVSIPGVKNLDDLQTVPYENESKTVISFEDVDYIIANTKNGMNVGKNLNLWGKGQYLVDCFVVKNCSQKTNGTAKVGNKAFYLIFNGCDNFPLIETSLKGSLYSAEDISASASAFAGEYTVIHRGSDQAGGILP